MTIRLPNDSEHVFICGQNGSGKTQAAVWQLSLRSYDVRPWIVIDFKREELINSIKEAQPLGFKDKIPTTPGIYIVKANISGDEENLEHLLFNIWARTGVGLYVDEGLALHRSRAFRGILTQGRSLRIPVIFLAQRAVWIDRFILSEVKYHQYFYLHNRKDHEHVRDVLPVDIGQYFGPGAKEALPDYHSLWYDVNKRKLTFLRPVPDAKTILGTFEERLKRRYKIIA